MSTDDLESPPEELSIEELMEALKSGGASIQEILVSKTLRQRVRQLMVKQDIEEHREVYYRLAEI